MKKVNLPDREKWISIYILNTSVGHDKWDFASIFRNNNPIEIEIGSGNGHFLEHHCRLHSNINYIGIEYTFKRVLKSIQKVYRDELDNIRFACQDANLTISGFIPEESVSQYYYNFPDPWPKKKHHKNRLFTRKFLKNIVKTLKTEGVLTIATDHKEYLDWMLDILLLETRLENMFDVPYVHELPEYYPTLYESKWRNLGRSIYYCRYVKKGNL